MDDDSSMDLAKIRDELARHGLRDIARVHRFDTRRRTSLGEWTVILEVLEELRSTTSSRTYRCSVRAEDGTLLMFGTPYNTMLEALKHLPWDTLDERLDAWEVGALE